MAIGANNSDDFYIRITADLKGVKEEFQNMLKSLGMTEKYFESINRNYEQVHKNAKQASAEAKNFSDNIEKAFSSSTDNVDALNKSLKMSEAIGEDIENIFSSLGAGLDLSSIQKTFTQLNTQAVSFARTQDTLLAMYGTQEDANKVYDRSIKLLSDLNISYKDGLSTLIPFIKSSENFNLTLDETFKIYEAVAIAGKHYSLSNAKIKSSLKALTDMMTKGTVQSHELRDALGKQIPGAVEIMADALGMTTEELFRKMGRGEITNAKQAVLDFSSALKDTEKAALDVSTGGLEASLTGLRNQVDSITITIMKSGLIDALKSVSEITKQALASPAVQKATEILSNTIKFLGNNIEFISKALKTLVAIKFVSFIFDSSKALQTLIGNNKEWIMTQVQSIKGLEAYNAKLSSFISSMAQGKTAQEAFALGTGKVKQVVEGMGSSLAKATKDIFSVIDADKVRANASNAVRKKTELMNNVFGEQATIMSAGKKVWGSYIGMIKGATNATSKSVIANAAMRGALFLTSSGTSVLYHEMDLLSQGLKLAGGLFEKTGKSIEFFGSTTNKVSGWMDILAKGVGNLPERFSKASEGGFSFAKSLDFVRETSTKALDKMSDFADIGFENIYKTINDKIIPSVKKFAEVAGTPFIKVRNIWKSLGEEGVSLNFTLRDLANGAAKAGEMAIGMGSKLVSGMGTALSFVGKLITNIGLAAGMIGSAMATAVAAIGPVALAIAGVTTLFMGLYKAIKPFVGAMGKSLKVVFSAVLSVMTSVADVIGIILRPLGLLLKLFLEFIGYVTELAAVLIKLPLAALSTTVSLLLSPFKSLTNEVGESSKAFFEQARETLDLKKKLESFLDVERNVLRIKKMLSSSNKDEAISMVQLSTAYRESAEAQAAYSAANDDAILSADELAGKTLSNAKMSAEAVAEQYVQLQNKYGDLAEAITGLNDEQRRQMFQTINTAGKLALLGGALRTANESSKLLEDGLVRLHLSMRDVAGFELDTAEDIAKKTENRIKGTEDQAKKILTYYNDISGIQAELVAKEKLKNSDVAKYLNIAKEVTDNVLGQSKAEENLAKFKKEAIAAELSGMKERETKITLIERELEKSNELLSVLKEREANEVFLSKIGEKGKKQIQDNIASLEAENKIREENLKSLKEFSFNAEKTAKARLQAEKEWQAQVEAGQEDKTYKDRLKLAGQWLGLQGDLVKTRKQDFIDNAIAAGEDAKRFKATEVFGAMRSNMEEDYKKILSEQVELNKNNINDYKVFIATQKLLNDAREAGLVINKEDEKAVAKTIEGIVAQAGAMEQTTDLVERQKEQIKELAREEKEYSKTVNMSKEEYDNYMFVKKTGFDVETKAGQARLALLQKIAAAEVKRDLETMQQDINNLVAQKEALEGATGSMEEYNEVLLRQSAIKEGMAKGLSGTGLQEYISSFMTASEQVKNLTEDINLLQEGLAKKKEGDTFLSGLETDIKNFKLLTKAANESLEAYKKQKILIDATAQAEEVAKRDSSLGVEEKKALVDKYVATVLGAKKAEEGLNEAVEKKEKAAEGMKSWKKYQEDLTLQIENEKLLTMSLWGGIEAYERQLKVIEATNQARSLGLNVDDKQIQEQIQGVVAQTEALEAQKEATQRLKDLQEQTTNKLISSFDALINKTKSFKDVLKDLALQMAEVAAKSFFEKDAGGGIAGLGGLAKMFGGGGGGALGGEAGGSILSSLTSMFGFAKGTALEGGKVIPFANGGVFDSPTAFPMAGGSTGLFAEKGPEAIMPLTRDGSGKLGVRSSGEQGGGRPITVVQNISTPDASSFKKSGSQVSSDMYAMLQQGRRNM